MCGGETVGHFRIGHRIAVFLIRLVQTQRTDARQIIERWQFRLLGDRWQRFSIGDRSSILPWAATWRRFVGIVDSECDWATVAFVGDFSPLPWHHEQLNADGHNQTDNNTDRYGQRCCNVVHVKHCKSRGKTCKVNTNPLRPAGFEKQTYTLDRRGLCSTHLCKLLIHRKRAKQLVQHSMVSWHSIFPNEFPNTKPCSSLHSTPAKWTMNWQWYLYVKRQ